MKRVMSNQRYLHGDIHCGMYITRSIHAARSLNLIPSLKVPGGDVMTRVTSQNDLHNQVFTPDRMSLAGATP